MGARMAAPLAAVSAGQGAGLVPQTLCKLAVAQQHTTSQSLEGVVASWPSTNGSAEQLERTHHPASAIEPQLAGCGSSRTAQQLPLPPELHNVAPPPRQPAGAWRLAPPTPPTLAAPQSMGLLSFLFFEGRWSEEDECADFALAVVLTVKALLGGAPLLHTGAPVGAAFEVSCSWQGWRSEWTTQRTTEHFPNVAHCRTQPASLDLSAGCPPGCPDMSEWIAMREHAARGLVHKLEALGAAVHWHDSSEIGVELWFAAPLGALPLRALLRSLRRWHPRAFDGCRHAAQHGPQMRLLWEHLGDSGAPDWSSLTLLATQFTAASRGIPGALAVAAARSGVAAFQRLFPFLAAFEYCPVQPWCASELPLWWDGRQKGGGRVHAARPLAAPRPLRLAPPPCAGARGGATWARATCCSQMGWACSQQWKQSAWRAPLPPPPSSAPRWRCRRGGTPAQVRAVGRAGWGGAGRGRRQAWHAPRRVKPQGGALRGMRWHARWALPGQVRAAVRGPPAPRLAPCSAAVLPRGGAGAALYCRGDVSRPAAVASRRAQRQHAVQRRRLRRAAAVRRLLRHKRLPVWGAGGAAGVSGGNACNFILAVAARHADGAWRRGGAAV